MKLIDSRGDPTVSPGEYTRRTIWDVIGDAIAPLFQTTERVYAAGILGLQELDEEYSKLEWNTLRIPLEAYNVPATESRPGYGGADGGNIDYLNPNIPPLTTENPIEIDTVLNPNPVTITSTAIQLALANRNRDEMIVSNTGTSSVLIGFGFIPTTTNYTFILKGGATANDGSGGILISDAWKGSVWAILAANQAQASSTVVFTEIPI